MLLPNQPLIKNTSNGFDRVTTYQCNSALKDWKPTAVFSECNATRRTYRRNPDIFSGDRFLTDTMTGFYTGFNFGVRRNGTERRVTWNQPKLPNLVQDPSKLFSNSVKHNKMCVAQQIKKHPSASNVLMLSVNYLF